MHTYLTKGHWFRKVSAVGTISIGRHIYQLGYIWRPDGYAEITFDPITLEFVCSTPSGKEKRLPLPWLTKEELMGDLFQFQQIPFQFALPFSQNKWRALCYTHVPAMG